MSDLGFGGQKFRNIVSLLYPKIHMLPKMNPIVFHIKKNIRPMIRVAK